MPAPSTRTRRRPVRALAQPIRNVAKPSLTSSLLRLSTSRPAPAAFFVGVGAAVLVGVAIPLMGPKRLERDVSKPLRNAIEPQTDKLWAESRPLREQIAGLFRSATPSARERLVKNFQSWIGHFHAT